MISRSLLNQLRYVKVADSTIDLQYFPDFMIVGPQRTGTTWLSNNLRWHPQIMMSVPKEIHFFNKLNQPQHPRFRSDKLDWYLSFFREPTSTAARERMACLFRYGEPYRPIVRGEATASYATLARKIIREISLLNPRLRIIMMIRNPVERAWSHAKMYFVQERKRRLEAVSDKEFAAFFSRRDQLRCAQYIRNMDRWLSCIDKESLFVGWFDDLERQPRKLLLDVMSLLGVKSDKKYIDLEAMKNIKAPVGLPRKYRNMIESLVRDDIRAVEERFGLSWR